MSRCMCGDPYCPTCSPANSRCLVCGRWLIGGGCEDPAKCAGKEEKLVTQLEKLREMMDPLGIFDMMYPEIRADTD